METLVSLVVDVVLLGGTHSVLVIWGLMLNSVFCQILPRKKVMLFAPHHLHRDASFSTEHSHDNLAYQ